MCGGCCENCTKKTAKHSDGMVRLEDPYEGYAELTFTDVEVARLRDTGKQVTKNGMKYEADESGSVFEMAFGTLWRIGVLPNPNHS